MLFYKATTKTYMKPGMFTHISFQRHVHHSPNRIEKFPVEVYVTHLYTNRQAILSLYTADLVLQKCSSTGQKLDVGSAPSTSTSFSRTLPSSHVYSSWNSTNIHRKQKNERSLSLHTLTTKRSPLNRASVSSHMVLLRIVSMYLFRLTSKSIALSLHVPNVC